MDSVQAEILVEITSLLNQQRIPYMITGALSVIYYGRPRASHDIDLVVELNEQDLPRFLTAIQTRSSLFMIQQEAVKHALRHASLFGIIHRQSLLKVDCWMLKKTAFDQSAFRRRQKVKLIHHWMWITSTEDTILQKLRWYKQAKIEKHIVDAAFVYQIQQKQLDKKYLGVWAKKLGVTKYLKQVVSIDLEPYL